VREDIAGGLEHCGLGACGDGATGKEIAERAGTRSCAGSFRLRVMINAQLVG